jgi:hypothetical protein
MQTKVLLTNARIFFLSAHVRFSSKSEVQLDYVLFKIKYVLPDQSLNVSSALIS